MKPEEESKENASDGNGFLSVTTQDKFEPLT